ncbi:hypothetical protein MOQ_000748 [Trypanosoma cruzi marinkellei]|uniref:Uncharacterized protein n=1 Tax=Trypanosoma cruzi marinkellei TaxID=85056 RepID=K2PDL7_TRYCR|nr:hypothetical protein MOQ_000748 [Trypanosoma cruzi marinkellei]
MQQQQQPRIGGAPTPHAAQVKMSNLPPPSWAAQQSRGSLPGHLQGGLRSGSHISVMNANPSGEGAISGNAMESIHPRGKLVMVPPHLVGKMTPMPNPTGPLGGPTKQPSATPSIYYPQQSLTKQAMGKMPMGPPPTSQQGAARTSQSHSPSYSASVVPHAPLAQPAKKQVVLLANTPPNAPGQPRRAKGLLEGTRSSSSAGTLDLTVQQPVGNVWRARPLPASTQPQQSTAGLATNMQPSPSGGKEKKHSAIRGIWGTMKNALFGGSDENAERPGPASAPQTAQDANGGVCPIQRRPGTTGTASVVASMTAATGGLQNLEQNTNGGTGSQTSLGSMSVQQQQQQQQRQQLPSTNLGDDGQAITSTGVKIDPALPSMATVETTTGMATPKGTMPPPTPADEKSSPLVTSPTVQLRDEAGEAGIAPSSSVNAAKEGKKSHRHSTQKQHVLRFPSITIVDSDEDSSGSSRSSEPAKELGSTAQTAVFGSEKEGSQVGQKVHVSPSFLATLSMPSQLVTQQEKSDNTGVQAAGTRPFATSDHPPVSPDTLSVTTKTSFPDTLTRDGSRTPVRQLELQEEITTVGSTPVHNSSVEEQHDANPQKESLRPTAIVTHSSSLTAEEVVRDTRETPLSKLASSCLSPSSSLPPPLKLQSRVTQEAQDVNKSATRQRRQPQLRRDSSESCIRPLPLNSDHHTRDTGREILKETTSLHATRKPSRNDKDDGDNDEVDGRKEPETPRRGRSVTRVREKDYSGEGRRLISPSPQLLHSPIFHVRDVYQLYQELKREQEELQRVRFLRWRRHDSVLPGDYSGTHSRRGGTSTTHAKSPRQPWRTSSFHPDPFPPPSSMHRPLGYIEFRDGYDRAVTSGDSDNEADFTGHYASGGRYTPYRTLRISRLSSPQRAGRASAQRRRCYQQEGGPCDYSLNHPYEVTSFIPSRKHDDLHKFEEPSHKTPCGNGGNNNNNHNDCNNPNHNSARRDSCGDNKSGGRAHSALRGYKVNPVNANGRSHADTSKPMTRFFEYENDGMSTQGPPQQQNGKEHTWRHDSVPPSPSSLPVSARRRRENPSAKTPVGMASPHPRRSQPRSAVGNFTARNLRRCCSEGDIAGGHLCAPGGSPVTHDAVGRIPIPVVDLRKDFKPCLDSPLKKGEVFDASKHRVRCGVNYSVSSNNSSVHKKRNGATGRGAMSPSCHSHTQSTPLKRVPENAAGNSGSSPKRCIIDLPPFPPLKLYSSFVVKEPDRPSAWAMGPERQNLLAQSPTARRRIIKRGNRHETAAGNGGRPTAEDDATAGINHDSVVLVEELRLDEYGRPYVLIREVPFGAAAVEAQKSSAQRLSRPRPVYVRPDDGKC